MSCFHPLTAYRAPPGSDFADGKPIIFDSRYKDYIGVVELKLPCGQCIGCRLENSRQWAMRICHEQSLHRETCFITLTYNDDNLPPDMSLQPDDMTLFIKRLRKALEPKKVRFFYAGEYGTQTLRPHYHMCLFGHDFLDDRQLYKVSSRGDILWTSQTLEQLWGKGYAPFGQLTFDSAAYTARYILKKITGDMAVDHYGARHPEFVRMSRRPGIASSWFAKYSSDVYPKDFVTIRNGIKCRPPRYYDKLFALNHCEELFDIKKRRLENVVVDSEDRLMAKEKVARLRTSTFLKRRLD